MSMTKTRPLVFSMFLTDITVVYARRKTLVPSRYSYSASPPLGSRLALSKSIEIHHFSRHP